jgi:hypothetical protein
MLDHPQNLDGTWTAMIRMIRAVVYMDKLIGSRSFPSPCLEASGSLASPFSHLLRLPPPSKSIPTNHLFEFQPNIPSNHGMQVDSPPMTRKHPFDLTANDFSRLFRLPPLLSTSTPSIRGHRMRLTVPNQLPAMAKPPGREGDDRLCPRSRSEKRSVSESKTNATDRTGPKSSNLLPSHPLNRPPDPPGGQPPAARVSGRCIHDAFRLIRSSARSLGRDSPDAAPVPPPLPTPTPAEPILSDGASVNRMGFADVEASIELALEIEQGKRMNLHEPVASINPGQIHLILGPVFLATLQSSPHSSRILSGWRILSLERQTRTMIILDMRLTATMPLWQMGRTQIQTATQFHSATKIQTTKIQTTKIQTTKIQTTKIQTTKTQATKTQTTKTQLMSLTTEAHYSLTKKITYLTKVLTGYSKHHLRARTFSPTAEPLFDSFPVDPVHVLVMSNVPLIRGRWEASSNIIVTTWPS